MLFGNCPLKTGKVTREAANCHFFCTSMNILPAILPLFKYCFAVESRWKLYFFQEAFSSLLLSGDIFWGL